MIGFVLLGSMLAAAAPPPVAAPTDVVPLFYSEIVRTADVIATGTVTARECRYENGRATIRTYVTLGDLTFHKGRAQETLTLRFEGGEIGEDVLFIAGMPRLRIGGRYLLFVDGTAKADKVSPIVGFSQGVFEIAAVNGRDVLRNLQGQELIGVQNDRFVFRARPVEESAKRDEPGQIVESGEEFRPAHPNANALEARMLAERTRREARPPSVPQLPSSRDAGGGPASPPPSAAVAKPATGDRALAVPLVLDRRADPGTRASVADILALAPIERRR